MSKKVVYLGQPCYGGPTMGAARSFFRALRGDTLEGNLLYLQASLLNTNCSGLWAWALNAVTQGKRVDYFAMLHADISAPDGWLTDLVEELERKNLDVLSVVSPIKDPRGLTSTAIGSSNVFRPITRVSMRDVFNLPETWTAADCGHPDKPLLFNTGMFVCRFDIKWAKHLYFDSRTRITFDATKNAYIVETEPEDWFFARLCHVAGLKTACTRRIPIMHRGETDFSNSHQWGHNEFDTEWAKEPAIIPARPQPWPFPHDVEGWLSVYEGRALAELARGKRVLELGAYCGRSTICLAQYAEHVVSVDTFDGRATPNPGQTLGRFKFNIRAHEVDRKVTAIAKPFAEFFAGEPLAKFDVIFIDGAHDECSVISDSKNAARLLERGGVIAFHDYGPRDPGVVSAVDKLLAAGATMLEKVDTLAIVRLSTCQIESVF